MASVLKLASLDEELLRIRECQTGNSAGLTFLRGKYHTMLMGTLVSRGASPTEAEDLLANLWGECVPGRLEGASLLEKFNGKCPLSSWLVTVATRRLIDLKRRQRFVGDPPGETRDGNSTGFFERIPDLAHDEAPDNLLIDLLRQSLVSAMDRCEPDAIIMLRLVYLYDLSQREVGRMWGWHETKVSRALTKALNDIRKHTLKRLQETDPNVKLTWEDFLNLCRTENVGFL